MLFGIFEQFQCPALQGEANCGKQPDILVGYALEIAGGTTVDLGPLQGLQFSYMQDHGHARIQTPWPPPISCSTATPSKPSKEAHRIIRSETRAAHSRLAASSLWGD
ncbi:MAG: hypothetical protein OXF73_12800 [Gammaproteobacteria bacterium]|nr:hypothetical protein [Gammaproteobacteria bacterium]